MTVEHDNRETPPAVEPVEYEGPPTSDQRDWNRGTSTIIIGVAVIFIVVIVVYIITR